jgi:nanoRNase/pAp phosphatase (c-di-AMP/oligoRNAs hydrolase)
MENQQSLKQQIASKLKEANNVLVTVSTNPSVDQLAGAIGLTLLLNKMGKHATAVFSGQVPSTIEFLEPEKTIEKTTDSLRDFIIALDKAKADKLRYKVEDKLVKIFITPYRTSLSEKDLEFSQGDFNVDVVFALGVKQREQLDQAIIAHGRILHDATVISVNTTNNGELGTLNLLENTASSLCEVVVSIIELMQSTNMLDGQMATAFLTGVVAETDRFRNAKTTPEAMSISSKLMQAGANQQLIANKLEESEKKAIPADKAATLPKVAKSPSSADGTMQIKHEAPPAAKPQEKPPAPLNMNVGEEEEGSDVEQIDIDEHGTLVSAKERQKLQEEKAKAPSDGNPKLVTKPPVLGGTLTANSRPEGLDPSTDPMTLPAVSGPLLSHAEPADGKNTPEKKTDKVDPEEPVEEMRDQTLTELEKFVDSPHIAAEAAEAKVAADSARDAVHQAINNSTQTPLEPIAALNANPVNLGIGHNSSGSGTKTNALPDNLVPKSVPTDETAAPNSPGAPPPVPPPMMPPGFNGGPSDDSQNLTAPL